MLLLVFKMYKKKIVLLLTIDMLESVKLNDVLMTI